LARVPYLDPIDVAPEYQDFFESLKRDGQMFNLHRTMAHAPHLMRQRSPFARALNSAAENQVSRATKELALLVIGLLTRCSYEYHHHCAIGLRSGLSAEQIRAVPFYGVDPIFSESEKALMRYAEEMTRDVQVSDETFLELQRHFTPSQIVEITLSISHYNGTVRYLEALCVRPGDGGI
jgi:alkylhydroperoxidase family enzyme